MDDLTTKRSFDLQAKLVIDVLGLFFDVIHGDSTTRHWQSSSQLVQEIGVCTVHVMQ